MIWRKYHIVVPQIIDATIRNLVPRDLSVYHHHHHHHYTGHLYYSSIPETYRVSWVYNFSTCNSVLARHTNITFSTNKHSALLIYGTCRTLLSQILSALTKLWKANISFMSGWLSVRPIGIRSPDRPSRSKSLHRLSYPELHGYKYVYKWTRNVSFLEEFWHFYQTALHNIPASLFVVAVRSSVQGTCLIQTNKQTNMEHLGS